MGFLTSNEETAAMELKKQWLNINGADRMILFEPDRDLLSDVIRRLGLTGTKVGCGTGVCGACSVLLDGKVVRSCTRKMKSVNPYSKIVTIEGVGTPTCLHPLQQAWITYGGVQCGFCTPGFIVSAKGLLDENPSPTREEVRNWFQKHRNVCRCTGYKPLVDAVMAAAKVLRGEATIDDISYQLPIDGNYYGDSVPRPTALAKVCGTCDYGDDIKLKLPPETLHAVIVQPKKAHHADILSIDYSEAEQMPGVVKVITAKDVKGDNRLQAYLAHKRSCIVAPTRPLICDKKIFRYGDVVALVAADTEQHARAAANAVKVELKPLPEHLTYLDAVLPGAIRVHEEYPNVFLKQPVHKGESLACDVIESSKHSAEGSFYSSREPHMSIEGDVAQAYWGEDGLLTIHCKAQALTRVRDGLAKGIGLEPSQIRVIENPTGASFGWAMTPGSFGLAAIAAMETGMPVTLSFTYEEHHHYSGKRCPAFINARIACDENGKLTALEYDAGVDHGPYADSGDGLAQRMSRFMGFPYYFPNVSGLVRLSSTNHNFGVAYRGFGSPQVYTASESLIDMLAEQAGIDPFEFRYRNIAREGQTNINSYPFRQYPMEEIMDKMHPYYERAVKKAATADTPEVRRGVGLAWGGYNVTGGKMDHATVAVSINPDDTFTQYNTWEDQGQGGDVGTVMHMLEAFKPLKLTPDRVKLVQNDSAICPDSGMAAGSRSHYMTGKATIIAAKKLLDAMRKPDGSYRNYDEMVAEGIEVKYFGRYENAIYDLPNIDPNTGVGDPTPAYTYGLFMAEVEVETATGITNVIGFTCVDDVGVIGNKASVDGQAYGGISHSIGFALKENYDDVKKHTNIYKSGIPYIKDIPDKIELIHCENPRDDGPFGSSGASEVYQSSGHAAILNGIYNATGVRIFELPATPEKVLSGIKTLAAGGTIAPPAKYYLGSELYDELDDLAANPV